MKAKMSPRDHDRDGPNLTGEALHARLARTWGRPEGFWGWLSSTDHKEIGKRYLVTAFIFLALGGILGLAIRAQLARPESGLIDPDRYNEIFTTHGSTMMFLFAVPVMEAFAVYLVPLMLGTRNITFPRLNAFSYYVYLSGGLMVWVAFALNIGPDVGWFAYLPPHNVASQQKIWRPFGTAISMLEAVKKLAPSCGMPVVNMWCTQSPKLRNDTEISASTSSRYPKMGRRLKVVMISEAMPVAGRKMM